jgi:hypothetical protein
MAAGRVRASICTEVLLDGHPAQAEIAANGDMVELERGSRRETGRR